MTFPLAQSILRAPHDAAPDDFVSLSYEDRFLRRKKLITAGGTSFVVDLEQTESLNHGDIFPLSDGSKIGVAAARESLLEVTGANLARLAWHIGNRHTPCQVEAKRLLIQNDPVIRHMLDHLGAQIHEVTEAFTPEGGAYGHGRTHSHDHGHSAHAH